MIDAVVGFGANLGEVRASFRSALARLDAVGEVVARSSLYSSAAVGPPQPDYLNAAIRLHTELEPRELLDRLLAIERDLGRERRERWGPRVIDLDILWIAGHAVDEPGLTVPHPRLGERPFALLPLIEVAPDATDPRSGASYAALADAAAHRAATRHDERLGAL
jgi:2-amino-4-hydroxy-6-hydroxymethyldihydropteridine diphosphokinase